MLNRKYWARAATLTATTAILCAALSSGAAFAQESPTQALEQARSGEDGSSGAGATSGNLSSGNAGRDRNGNGNTSTETATAGGAGDTGAAETPEENTAPLPENAELLDALGVLDDVTIYGLDVLTGLDIPVELLPPPVAEPVSSVPTDVNTGGQGGSAESSSVSTEPGTGAAPASGATSSAAEDGVGSSSGGENTRDRPRNNADGGTDSTSTASG